MARGKEIWVCPRCAARVDISELGLYAEVSCPRCYYTERVHMQLGNFRLENVLGIGGMSVVYRALDVTLNRPVALKVLNDTFRGQPERIERFEKESAMMARVRHENVTSVYSAGKAYGQFYIAMELVDGKNLEHMVSQEQPLSAPYALEVVRQVAMGLRAANEAGLLHRDMKPGNILITQEERVKVIDFGLALADTADDTEEVIWATPYYVPPETLRRRAEDVRTDIYALGMTLRYLLTGEETFSSSADSVSALLDRKRHLPPFAKQRPDLNPTLCDLVDHMTQYSMDGRPSNYDELLDEIEDVQQALAKDQKRGPEKFGVRRLLRWLGLFGVVGGLGYCLACVVSRCCGPVIPKESSVFVQTEQVTGVPPQIGQLRDVMTKIGAEEFDEAVDQLLTMSQQEQDGGVAAWAAYLARVITQAVPVKDGRAKADAAKKRLSQLLAIPLQTSPSTASLWGYLKAHGGRIDPKPTDWYNATGGWTTLQLGQLSSQTVRAELQGGCPAPMLPDKLMELAEMALWQGSEDVVIDECYAALQEVCAHMTDYAELGRLYARVMQERLSVRRVAKIEGEMERTMNKLLRTLPTQADIDALTRIANNPKLPTRLRQLAGVRSEAAQLGMHMGQMLVRKASGKLRADMSLGQMMALVEGSGPEIRSNTAEAAHPAKHAMDGDKETRWCAANRALGLHVTVQFPEKKQVDSAVFYWEDNAEQTYRVQTYCDGREVQSIEVKKKEGSSRVALSNQPIDEIRLSLVETGWAWASVREIEFYDKQGKRIPMLEHHQEMVKLPRDVLEDIRVVVAILEQNAQVESLLESHVRRTGDEKNNFRAIAISWLKRLGGSRDARSMVFEPLGDKRDEKLAELFETVKRCRVVVVEEGMNLAFLNMPTTFSGGLNMLDEQQIAFLQHEGVVKLGDEPSLPVYGLKEERFNQYSLRVGCLQPVPQSTAEHFVEMGNGVVIHSVDELRARLKNAWENPTPFFFNRVPVYNFSGK